MAARWKRQVSAMGGVWKTQVLAAVLDTVTTLTFITSSDWYAKDSYIFAGGRGRRHMLQCVGLRLILVEPTRVVTLRTWDRNRTLAVSYALYSHSTSCIVQPTVSKHWRQSPQNNSKQAVSHALHSHSTSCTVQPTVSKHWRQSPQNNSKQVPR